MNPKKKIKIEFAPHNKITKKAHELVRLLFDTDGMITDESYLDDFLSFSGNDLSKDELENEHVKMVEKIKHAYGILVPEILEGEIRIWKIAELIEKRQKEKKQREELVLRS